MAVLRDDSAVAGIAAAYRKEGFAGIAVDRVEAPPLATSGAQDLFRSLHVSGFPIGRFQIAAQLLA